MCDDMIPNRSTESKRISLVDLLRCRAAAGPELDLFAFLPDGEDSPAATITRGELDRRARALAVRLRDLGVDSGRVLLLYPPGLDFIVAFFGCLYAGVTAVPVHLPRLNRPMTRLRSIVVDAKPCAVLTSSSQSKDASRWEVSVPEMRDLHRLVADEATADLAELAERWKDPGATPDTLAFLQYTSGSTAAPKGVMITHGNLLENSARIHTSFGSTPDGSRGLLVAAVPRHGFDRRRDPDDLLRRVEHALLAGLVPPTPDQMAASHFMHRREHQRRAQLRLRSLRGEDHARATCRARP